MVVLKQHRKLLDEAKKQIPGGTFRPKPLTYRQRCDLRALLRDDSFQAGYGCTNMTMAALERRGFVKYCWTNVFLSSAGHWEITEAGRAALASQ